MEKGKASAETVKKPASRYWKIALIVYAAGLLLCGVWVAVMAARVLYVTVNAFSLLILLGAFSIAFWLAVLVIWLFRKGPKGFFAWLRCILATLAVVAVGLMCGLYGLVAAFNIISSRTNDPQNYLKFDSWVIYDAAALNAFPNSIPKEAENVSYSYTGEDFFGSMRLYASWTLPHETLAAEQERLAQSGAATRSGVTVAADAETGRIEYSYKYYTD